MESITTASGFTRRIVSSTRSRFVSHSSRKLSLISPIRLALILICFKDSSPEIYSTFLAASDSFRHTCRSSVDFPIPGSPPTNVSEPGTMPPPNTRFSSPIPALILSSFPRDTSDSREGSALCLAPAETVFTVPPIPLDVMFTLSSVNVFHALQPGHCPIHLADSYPHS